MDLDALDKACLDCGYHACICGKEHPEGRCPDDCGHSLSAHGASGCAHLDGHDRYCECGYVPELVIEAIRVTMIKLYGCRTHSSYAAKRAPRSACEKCWRLWIKVSDS